MIRSKTLAHEVRSIYSSGKEFAYDHVMQEVVFTFKRGSDTRINLRVNPQRRSLKGILLLFVEPYTDGNRDSEKYIYPDLTKVSVTVNGSFNMLYNNGIKGKNFWEKAYRFFKPKNNKKPFIDMTKFYAKDNFGLLIYLRSMRDQSLHGSGTRLREHKRRCPAWTREESQRLRRGGMPCLRHKRCADEHNGSTIRICAVLIIWTLKKFRLTPSLSAQLIQARPSSL